MKQLNVPSLLVLKWHFGISNGGLGSAVKLSTLDLYPWRKEVVLHKKGLLKTLRCYFMYWHTCAVELLYKCNITLVDVRYGCISACCDYLRHLACRYTAISHAYSCDIAYILYLHIYIYIYIYTHTQNINLGSFMVSLHCLYKND